MTLDSPGGQHNHRVLRSRGGRQKRERQCEVMGDPGHLWFEDEDEGGERAMNGGCRGF